MYVGKGELIGLGLATFGARAVAVLASEPLDDAGGVEAVVAGQGVRIPLCANLRLADAAHPGFGAGVLGWHE